ncbi:MAG: glyoxalase [Methanocorpusculum sp.]|nr:glyoxalase [Methanocorpusculum sp.]
MNLKSSLLVVKDMDAAKAFYAEVLGLSVEQDFGANVTLTGGLSLQTEASWKEFLSADEVSFGGCDAEIYFEEDNYDAFLKRLSALSNICYVHPPLEHRWGQRVCRIYDLDKHIIEIAEPLSAVIRRFAGEGMSDTEIAERMDIPLDMVTAELQ